MQCQGHLYVFMYVSRPLIQYILSTLLMCCSDDSLTGLDNLQMYVCIRALYCVILVTHKVDTKSKATVHKM